MPPNPVSRLVDPGPLSAEAEDHGTQIAVSSRFYPGGVTMSDIPLDVVFVSLDKVFFYVHSRAILAASSNTFAHLIDPAAFATLAEGRYHVVVVREPSPVLNIILHAIYAISCAQYRPSNAELIAAVDALPAYGLETQKHLARETALFQLLATRLHTEPLEFYALAGHHGVHDLAALASTHLLGCKIGGISLETADRMGAMYLSKLIALQLVRQDALKTILANPPEPHPFVETCGDEEQASLGRAWQLVAAYLIWEMRPRA